MSEVPFPVPPAPPPPLGDPGPPVPRATLKPAGKPFLSLGWFWVLPGAVLVIVSVVLYLSSVQRGERIVVHFKEGHGLRAGDAVRTRGITVGEVRAVELSPDREGVSVTIDLRPTAGGVAVEGSRFWIVRPQADLTGLSGLETVVGSKYVAVLPGSGAAQHEFGGEEAPVPETLVRGGLRIVLQGDQSRGLPPASPLTYRQVRIGSVEAVDLASDSTKVDVHVYVLPAYASL